MNNPEHSYTMPDTVKAQGMPPPKTLTPKQKQKELEDFKNYHWLDRVLASYRWAPANPLPPNMQLDRDLKLYIEDNLRNMDKDIIRKVKALLSVFYINTIDKLLMKTRDDFIRMKMPEIIINILEEAARNINEWLNKRNISEWLIKIGLNQYNDALLGLIKKKDITNITYDDIKDITEEELTDAGLKIYHAKRFIRERNQMVDEAEASAAAAEAQRVAAEAHAANKKEYYIATAIEFVGFKNNTSLNGIYWKNNVEFHDQIPYFEKKSNQRSVLYLYWSMKWRAWIISDTIGVDIMDSRAHFIVYLPPNIIHPELPLNANIWFVKIANRGSYDEQFTPNNVLLLYYTGDKAPKTFNVKGGGHRNYSRATPYKTRIKNNIKKSTKRKSLKRKKQSKRRKRTKRKSRRPKRN